MSRLRLPELWRRREWRREGGGLQSDARWDQKKLIAIQKRPKIAFSPPIDKPPEHPSPVEVTDICKVLEEV